LKYNSKLI